MRFKNTIRRGIAAVALLSSGTIAGCSAAETLLEVSDPDIIPPENASTEAAANALRVGALARLNSATSGGESTILLGGLLADEYRSSDTFLQRNETDRRAIQPSNAQTTAAFRSLHRARLAAEQAITALREWEAPAWQVAQMYLVQGFVENQLAEDFCGHIPFSTVVNGVEVLGGAQTTRATLERALAHVDSGLTELGTGATANDNAMRNGLSVIRGRILINLDRYAEAATAVANVPTTYQFVMEHSANSSTNQIWSLNNSIGRWYVSQGEGTNGIDFVTPADPRVPTCYLTSSARVGCNSDTPVSRPFDTSVPTINGRRLIVQQKWPTRYASVAIITGVEARLIEAEAQLGAGQPATALATLNALRATQTGLAPLTLQTTTTAQEDQLFRERAFWLFSTGHRLGDLRRLVHQYNRPANTVFPTGSWWKGGEYGNDVNIPVPQAEENNPDFSRASCVTTEAFTS